MNQLKLIVACLVSAVCCQASAQNNAGGGQHIKTHNHKGTISAKYYDSLLLRYDEKGRPIINKSAREIDQENVAVERRRNSMRQSWKAQMERGKETRKSLDQQSQENRERWNTLRWVQGVSELSTNLAKAPSPMPGYSTADFFDENGKAVQANVDKARTYLNQKREEIAFKERRYQNWVAEMEQFNKTIEGLNDQIRWNNQTLADKSEQAREAREKAIESRARAADRAASRQGDDFDMNALQSEMDRRLQSMGGH